MSCFRLHCSALSYLVLLCSVPFSAVLSYVIPLFPLLACTFLSYPIPTCPRCPFLPVLSHPYQLVPSSLVLHCSVLSCPIPHCSVLTCSILCCLVPSFPLQLCRDPSYFISFFPALAYPNPSCPFHSCLILQRPGLSHLVLHGSVLDCLIPLFCSVICPPILF